MKPTLTVLYLELERNISQEKSIQDHHTKKAYIKLHPRFEEAILWIQQGKLMDHSYLQRKHTHTHTHTHT